MARSAKIIGRTDHAAQRPRAAATPHMAVAWRPYPDANGAWVAPEHRPDLSQRCIRAVVGWLRSRPCMGKCTDALALEMLSAQVNPVWVRTQAEVLLGQADDLVMRLAERSHCQ